jgi:hypothetical protein
MENNKNTLENLLKKVQDMRAAKEDLIAPTNNLQFRTVESSSSNNKSSEIILEGEGGIKTRILKVNDVCFDQIAADKTEGESFLDVRTARRLRRDYPNQFDNLINAHWQQRPKQKTIRSFVHENSFDHIDGTARAFVSDKFNTFDNEDLLEAALPSLMESDAQWEIVNADITEKRLYARFKSKVIEGIGAGVGDIMALGLGLSNSETGHGSISLFQINWTLACTNGMQTENRTRSNHVTSSRSDAGQWKLLSDETKDLDNRALKAKIRDLAIAFSSRDSFDEVLEKMRIASEDVIEGEIINSKAIPALAEVLKINKKDTSPILEGLLKTVQQSGYNNTRPNRATLVNAVTAVANTVDPDSVDDWQKYGGQILNMSPSNWSKINKASLEPKEAA